MTSLLIKLFVKNKDNTDNPKVRKSYGVLATTTGIIVNILLFAGKLTIGIISMSVSIIADAFNNITDASSSVVTLFGFRFSEKRADADHPLGHGRFEYVSALIVDIIIIVVGIEFFKSSVEKIISPEIVSMSVPIIILLGIAVAIKIWLFFFYGKIAKAINSPAIRGVAFDSISDACATTVVLVSALIAQFTSLKIDGYAGLIVACMILFTGVKVAKETIDLLLGKSPDKHYVDKIYEFVRRYPDVVNIHDVMVHDYGPSRQIVTFHAEVPSTTDFCKAHDIIDQIEHDMQKELGAIVTIHLDPITINDERYDKLKDLTVTAVKSVYEALSIHDFRIVFAGERINVIFDLSVPLDYKSSPDIIREKVTARLAELDPRLKPIITIEHPFV